MSNKPKLVEIIAKALNHDRSGWSDVDWENQEEMHKADLMGHARACLDALIDAGFVIVPKTLINKMRNPNVQGEG